MWVSLTAVMMVVISQHDGWTTYRQTNPVKHAIQSADHSLIPEVVIVDVQFPGNPLHAHLVKTRDLKHGSNGESCNHKNRHASNNDEGNTFCRDASLISHGKENTDIPFS